MSVLAILTDSNEARSVIIAAHHTARALKTDLNVLCYVHNPIAEDSYGVSRADAEEQPLVSLAFDVLDELQADYSARPEEAASGSVRLIMHPNALTATIAEMRAQEAECVVASAESNIAMSGKQSFPVQLRRHVACNLLLVTTSGQRSLSAKRILAVTTDSPDDYSMVALAHRLAVAGDGHLTVAVLETDAGHQAKELGDRELKSVLKGAGIEISDRVRTEVVQTDYPINGVISIADDYDLVLLASNNLGELPRLRASTYDATISVFRKATPIRPWQSGNRRRLQLIPALAPADYADLVQNLRTGSRWNADFKIMLGLAVGIASLGLLLNSAAVIIGSMLLAPLMTPMLGMGLALVQGNARLARTSATAVGFGVLLAVAISFVVGLTLPGEELTPELTSRGSPNIIDLLIALLSAAAAAYALARPTLAGSIAGVAIATALVPPLCTVGISLADWHFDNAVGAAMLFTTNFLAIVMAAAGMFRWMGLGATVDPVKPVRWVRSVVVTMLLVTLVLGFPLSTGLINRLRKGVSQAAAAPLSKSAYREIQAHIHRHPGVSLVFALRRPGSLTRSADYRVVVASESPLPRSFGDEVTRIVRQQMDDHTLRVEAIAVPLYWINEENDGESQTLDTPEFNMFR